MPPLSHLTYCTPTKSNLYLANSLAAALSEPDLYRSLTFSFLPKCPFSFSCCVMIPLETIPSGDPSGGVFYNRIVLSPVETSRIWVFLNNIFLQGGVVRASPNPQRGGPPLWAVSDCFINLLVANLYIGGRSPIRNIRTRNDVVIGTHKHGNWGYLIVLRLSHVMCILCCGYLVLFCNVWVCVL